MDLKNDSPKTHNKKQAYGDSPKNSNLDHRPSVSPFLKGSLTVETALVLPLFLFGVLILLMAGEAVRFSGNVNAALMETSRKLSIYAYAGEKAGLEKSIVGGKAVSMTLGKSLAKSELSKCYEEEYPAVGGTNGLSFIHSTVMGADEMVDLNAVWKLDTRFPVPGINGFKVIDRARIRAFTGYDNTHGSEVDHGDEEMVFVTETGTVYHRDLNCSHLKISISSTTRSDVGKKRNMNGGKYYPCEYCGGGKCENLFITEDGDRYHTKATCPGLKRTIHTVPLSATGGKPPCSSCGY